MVQRAGSPPDHVVAGPLAAAVSGRPAGPHLRLLVAVGSLNRLLADRVRRLAAVPVEVPGVRGLPVRWAGWTLALRRLNIGPAGDGRVAVFATVALRQGARMVTEADVTAEVVPRVERSPGGRGSRLVIPLRGRDLRQARLRLGGDLRRSLDDLLREQLPRGLRTRLPRALTDRTAGELATWLSEHLFGLARDHLLADVGALTTVTLRLPGVPLRGVDVRWRGTTLVLDATTALPVSRGLVEPDGLGGPGRGVRVVLRAATAAALYNWLAARGAVPARVDEGGRPAAGGAYEVFAVAGPPDRPWGVRAWDLRRCVELDLVGTPHVRVEDGRVLVSVDDGRLERVYGPPALEVGGWIRGLSAEALRASASFVAATTLTVGGERLSVRLLDARVQGEVILLDADWGAVGAASVSPRAVLTGRPEAQAPRGSERRRSLGVCHE